MILSHKATMVESDLFLIIIKLEFSVCCKAVSKKELGGTSVNDFSSPKKNLQPELYSLYSV